MTVSDQTERMAAIVNLASERRKRQAPRDATRPAAPWSLCAYIRATRAVESLFPTLAPKNREFLESIFPACSPKAREALSQLFPIFPRR
jgi:hypothetical protein